MSGVEVIGLLLGIFPLVVSALEHYQDVHKAARLLTRFETEYRKTLDDVKDEQLFLQLSLEELLLPLTNSDGLQDGDLETLLSDLTEENWKQADVVSALKSRLGRTHTRFMEIAKSLDSLTSRLLVTLVNDKPNLQAKIKARASGSEPSSGAQRLSQSALQRFLKRQFQYRKEQIEFGLGRPQRDEILKEIHKYNKRLEKLLEKSDKIMVFKKSTTVAASPTAVKSLLQYWQHADRIYALIHHSWGCPCKGKHCAYLWLQHRTSQTFEFKLLVLWAPTVVQSQPLPPWDRQGLQITLGSIPFEPNKMSAGSTVTKEGLSCNEVASVSSKNGKKRRVGFLGVQFRTPAADPDASDVALPTVDAEAKVNTSLLHEISKLCISMSTYSMQAACIGSLSDHEGGRQYSVYSEPEQKIATGEITLHDVLHGSCKQRLRRSDRFRIALAVASSHLQLQSTRWAHKQWEASDIRFPQDTGGHGAIMFDKPYVSADFNAALPAKQKAPKKTDRSFACLGIMLLELLFGSCLEDHELWEQLGFQENKAISMFRLVVAKQWVDSVEDEAGSDFSAAVIWCLNESPTTLEGDQWRRDIADRVV